MKTALIVHIDMDGTGYKISSCLSSVGGSLVHQDQPITAFGRKGLRESDQLKKGFCHGKT